MLCRGVPYRLWEFIHTVGFRNFVLRRAIRFVSQLVRYALAGGHYYGNEILKRYLVESADTCVPLHE